jgi:hypothetical protein
LNAQREISSVLIGDEAQAIERVKEFEELRLLVNFQLKRPISINYCTDRPARNAPACWGNVTVKSTDRGA